MSLRLVLITLALAALFLQGSAGAAKLTAEKSEQGVIIKIDGELFTEYVTASGPKPILWPIIGPTGKPMTRSYPIAKEPVEGERHDHPHHRSFWFTHGSVNGIDFWSEAKNHGRIVHREFVKIDDSGPQVVIVTRNDWLGPDGKKICEDERTLAFGAAGDQRWIDFDCVVKATSGPVVFGDTKEGSFGVRVAGTMKVDAKLGGKIVNSEGQTDGQAWGKPAAWVDYHGPVGDERLGIAILNHPTSLRYPNTWHVRTYGLFTANPFGLRDFSGRKADVNGDLKLESGESFVLRYRVLLHKGDEQEGKVAEAFEAYSKQER